jgi:hypothetical protein
MKDLHVPRREAYRPKAMIPHSPLLVTAGIALAALCSNGCGGSALPDETSGEMVRSECPAREDIAYYFPEGALIPTSPADERPDREFLSDFLRRQDAPSFSCGAAPLEGYRMVWAGGAASALLIAVVEGEQGWRIEWTQFDRALPGRPATIKSKDSRALTSPEATAVTSALENARFWSTRPPTGSGPEGLAWLLEGRADSRYRAILLGPALTPPFSDVAISFVALAGLTPPPLMLRAGS